MAFLVGFAGNSFSAGIAWNAAWFPKQQQGLALGIFGAALGTVILPKLSRQHAAAEGEGFAHTLDWGLRWSLLIGTPATVALAILAGPLLATLFMRGEFTAIDVEMTTRSLMTYGSGLIAYMLVKVLAPGFYARQDTKTPVRFGLISIGANIGFQMLLIAPLAHAGLALSTALAAFVNVALLYWQLRRDGVWRNERREERNDGQPGEDAGAESALHFPSFFPPLASGFASPSFFAPPSHFSQRPAYFSTLSLVTTARSK